MNNDKKARRRHQRICEVLQEQEHMQVLELCELFHVSPATIRNDLTVLEKKQLELEVNKYVLENPEANLEKIDILFDKIGAIEANILKDRIRSQIEMQKYITQEQYIKARDIAIRRLNTPK